MTSVNINVVIRVVIRSRFGNSALEPKATIHHGGVCRSDDEYHGLLQPFSIFHEIISIKSDHRVVIVMKNDSAGLGGHTVMNVIAGCSSSRDRWQ